MLNIRRIILPIFLLVFANALSYVLETTNQISKLTLTYEHVKKDGPIEAKKMMIKTMFHALTSCRHATNNASTHV